MTHKYKIVSIEETPSNELMVSYRVKPDKQPPFELSVTVKHNATEDQILKLINDTAYRNIGRREKKAKKEETEKANIDVMKQLIELHKDIDVDITEVENDTDSAYE